MTHAEKINYFNVAASIVGYKFDEKGVDMLVSLYDLIIEKQGESDLKSICVIQNDVEKRTIDRKRIELDKTISEKIDMDGKI